MFFKKLLTRISDVLHDKYLKLIVNEYSHLVPTITSELSNR